MDVTLLKDEVQLTESSTDGKEALEGKSEVPPSLAKMMSLIYGHQHKLRQIETKLKELLQNQQVLTEGLRGENERFKEAHSTFNLPILFGEVSVYTQKLRRAMRLQQQQQQKALNQEQQRAHLAEREKHLIARPVWASQQDDQ
ncbi:Biogenesis of lysosome-related organelles complex 1 subunit 6-like [Homarus americanus]|uniref:Biogenesis of lysosome-related organelles complex 1 subunit 6-like n=1 Tax=Homarus americanus TaxID=6706 RepID=A0A8J5N4Q4_HOMAM|nr:Biogenesis of lysosome-related organelles complex 1 subunit 6-like [Homarus americanus]